MIRVVLLLALAVQCVSSAQCLLGWQEFNGFCYAFHTDEVSWFVASATCQDYGGRLTQILSQAETNWINLQLTGINGNIFWIGGSDNLHEGTWTWIPSQKTIGNFQYWSPGQPDNFGDNENCLSIRKDFNSMWNDDVCTHNRMFICERKL